jgi:sigma-E factor negative regulatory protein RseB
MIRLATQPASHVRTPACWLVLGCVLAAAARAAEPESAGHAWLQRMSHALATRNYDGRFLHLSQGRVESMRIVHRVVDGVVTERLISLDGSGREVIRTATEVVCYLPDKRTALVEQHSDADPLLAAIPIYDAALKENYVFSPPTPARVSGRPVQVVMVQPRDEYRYGYRLWLDTDTAMPLQSELRDAKGRVVEQMVFSDLRLPARIPDEMLRPGMSTAGFRWVRQSPAPDAKKPTLAGWTLNNLPQGFRLTITRIHTIAGAPVPVRHLVFSDGLATVSVFIEPRKALAASQLGLARVGAAYAFSTDVQDHRITAVGEVPASTVQALAASVARDLPSKK